jgi:hypothetical protein
MASTQIHQCGRGLPLSLSNTPRPCPQGDVLQGYDAFGQWGYLTPSDSRVNP